MILLCANEQCRVKLQEGSEHDSMKVLTLVITVAIAVMPAASQIPAQKPAFEVVSIKPSTGGTTIIGNQRGGRFVAMNVSTIMLFLMAFRPMQANQIVGGPDWLRTDRFDIQAKADGALTPQQSDAAVRAILEDRFQLRTHREIRELAVFELGLTKGGAKLKPVDMANSVVPRSGMPPAGAVSSGPGRIVSSAIPTTQLATVLSAVLGRPVIDKTGMNGSFEVNLQFVPDVTTAQQDAGPTIFTALQEQLGLKLESAKGPVDVLVIESVSKPTEN